jgi:hypothetical protein
MLTTYGAKVKADAVTQMLEHSMATMRTQGPNYRPTPVCIWGLHGIGKTELVRALAQRLDAPLVYVAPAQFEEMGDLIGMPRIVGDTTAFAQPSWVPTRPGPGILLLDDVNRADDRILRGTMQLLQYYELVSWQLPPQWLIVLTANPDGGDYSVTPLDDAMLNRMLHVTMEFGPTTWAKWAESAGIDPRGIYFVLAYPELVNSGKRTTPRSLVQFFDLIAPFDNLEEHLPLVKLLGESCLDTETVQAFVNFIHLKLDKLPAPEEILDTPDMAQMGARIQRLTSGTGGSGVQRLDILSILIARLNGYLQSRSTPLEATQMERLGDFILLDFIPNDLRLSMAQELVQIPQLKGLYANARIAELLLKKM